jgi:hypothetical protein
VVKKLIVSHLVKKFPSLYGNRSFITAFTRARLLFLLWPDEFISHPSVMFLEIHFLTPS